MEESAMLNITSHQQNSRFRVILVFTLFGLSSICSAAEQNINPGINRHYEGAQYEEWVHTFERPGREVYDKRHEVVKALNLNPGMRVADVGAGTGFYSLLFSEQVGKSGKVYAVDITRDFVTNILRRARERGLDNIQGIISEDKSTRLPPLSVDLVFVCDTYHHFEYPQSMLSSIHTALRPGGRLVIIDFRKQPGVSTSWVMSHVRANKQTVIHEVKRAGFRFDSESPILKTNYFLTFTKK